MTAGEILDLGAKILVGVFTPLLGGLALWAFRRYARLRRIEAAYQDLRDEKAGLAGDVANLKAALAALEGRYERLRATDQEVREKFAALRAGYLALRQMNPHELTNQLRRAAATLAARTEELGRARERIRDLEAGAGTVGKRERELEDQLTAARAAVDALTAELEQARQEGSEIQVDRDQVRQRLEEAEARLADLARSDGRLWLRPPAGPVPPFRPRTDRRAVIVSVLNLKGGVGKTTLTANLAATLARPDRPVLMIDLDYQRSLSMLLVNARRRAELHGNRWTVQHFLVGAQHRLADLAGRFEDLSPAVPHCAILTNSHGPPDGGGAASLEEVENRLMAEWLFDRSRPDPRFFLRQALHDPGLGYGYVFLDCPPRLTTACVNALAASDFVLVPVVPDAVSTHAAENLLHTLKEFKERLFPDLAVAGIVPNMVRFRSGEPIEAHAEALRDLRDAANGVWRPPPPVFAAGIKQDSGFGVSAAEIDESGTPRLAVADPELRDAFRALADELEEEVRNASRHPATVPAQPAARAGSGR